MSTAISRNIQENHENGPILTGKTIGGKLLGPSQKSKGQLRERPVLVTISNKDTKLDRNIVPAKKKTSISGVTLKSNYKDVKAKVNTNNPLYKRSSVASRPSVLRRQESTIDHAIKAEISAKQVRKEKTEEPVVKVKSSEEQAEAKIEPSEEEQLEIKNNEIPQTVKGPTNFLNYDDIDKEDGGNTFLVSEYVNDIYSYLRQLERKHPVMKNFLQGQQITSQMRAVLIDWLIEVHTQFNLLLETLHLTVALIDRYLQVDKTTTKKTLQLVGVAAMYIACKYEEMYGPDVGDFVYIADKSYTKKEILAMEYRMLRTVNFELGRPLPLHFLRRYSKAGYAQPVHHTFSKFFIELSFVDYGLSCYHPSEISAAAFCLALTLVASKRTFVAPGTLWIDNLVYYSTYTFEHIEPIVYKLAALVVKKEASATECAVFNKYQVSQFMRVAHRSEIRGPAIKALAAKVK